MSITKAEILTFVNKVLQREETEIDVELRNTLDDLADLHCLRGVDSSQTLTSTSSYLVYPTDALHTEEAIISIQLRSPAGVWGPLLRPWPGGAKDHNRFFEGNPTRSTPEMYWPMQTGLDQWQLVLSPRPSSDWIAWIHYWRRHGAIGTNLEFSDDWRRAILFGAALEVASTYGLDRYIALWGARYNQEKDKRRALMLQEPAIQE